MQKDRRNLVIGLTVGGTALGVFLLVACGVSWLAFVKDRPTRPETKTYTREEFKALVMGKTADEVIKAVGKPNSTQETSNQPTWYYDRRTKDPTTGQIDWSVQVNFKDGIVVSVNWY